MDGKQKVILLTGTCDTKGEEILFMKAIIESKGLRCLVLDLGLKADPTNFKADITRQDLSEAIGSSLDELIAAAQAGRYEVAVEKLGGGAEAIIQKLYTDGKINGILSIGGSMGTAIGLRSLRALPVGFPKVLVSTVAVSDYLHPHFIKSDIILVQPISDFFGLTQWSKRDLKRAALTVCAVVEEEEPMEGGKWIGLTAIGWVASCAGPLKVLLEENGFKVAVAHSVSMQCAILEDLIRQGVIKGMVDLCSFEILHEVAGGSYHSLNRLTAAAEMGIPTIIGPGNVGAFTMSTLHMADFQKQGRFTIEHNEILGTAKASVEEMMQTAEVMAERLNKSKGKVAFVIPKRGFFNYDKEGKMYFNPEGREAFIKVIQKNLKSSIQLEILDCHWDDFEYVTRVGELCIEYFADIQ
jgi:uncharacterized protein (UPF0261 family)